MFINPKTAIENKWITGDISEKNIQPNAIDFTIDRVFSISNNDCAIAEAGKRMRGGSEVIPVPGARLLHSIDNVPEDAVAWKLRIGPWDCLSDFYVDLPEGVAAYLIVRSTFNRNGIFVTSGLYDSGYKGHIGFVLHNMGGDAVVAKGTRVGQIIFVASENAGVYSGGWNHEKGTYYLEDNK